MKKFILILVLFLLSASNTYALPTPSAKTLSWGYDEGTGIAGFYLYFTLESEASPRNYLDQNKIQISPDERSLVLLSVKPDAEGALCFRMTAFRAGLTGVATESEFTPEICGDFGVKFVTGFTIK